MYFEETAENFNLTFLSKVFSGDWSVYLFQETSNTPLFSVLSVILIRLVPPSEIANSISWIAWLFNSRNSCLKIIVTGIFTRNGKFPRFRIIVPRIHQRLKIFTSTYDFIDFLEPTKDWLNKMATLIMSYFGLIIYIFRNLEIKKLYRPIFSTCWTQSAFSIMVRLFNF